MPKVWRTESIAVVHATPDNLWRAPMPDAPDDQLRETYGRLDVPLIAYGHIHAKSCNIAVDDAADQAANPVAP